MAAITPATVRQFSMGDVKLVQADFTGAAIDDGDTWASGLGASVVGFWVCDTDNPNSQFSSGVAVQNSSGTFTFYPGEDNKAATLYVMTRS